MALVTIGDEDIEPVIKAVWRDTLRSQGRLPAVAFLVAVCTLPFSTHLGVAAFGAALAWSWSTVAELRSIRPRCLAYYAPLREPFSVDVTEDGVRFYGGLGDALLKWDGIAGVVNYPGAFVVESDNENTAILPKRCLGSAEILILESRSKARRDWAT